LSWANTDMEPASMHMAIMLMIFFFIFSLNVLIGRSQLRHT
jgi:hypothetical protein